MATGHGAYLGTVTEALRLLQTHGIEVMLEYRRKGLCLKNVDDFIAVVRNATDSAIG